ncbi:histidine--tRNA ligase [Candidatus Peregrinibacteria bacterium CG_4_10_14_0_2_um_filter_43_11]|nr:MAG: histidine--tRNA ligase [Candidatus Peregrinibacteria bacterium CG_4_10_14_0_2_um_filter_43_11]
MTQIITPKILKGTRDFLPKDMAKRQYVMEKIRSTFIRFGYDTIETPVIEYAETLLGKYGDEGSKLVYQFKDNGGRQIALRYDQTVPFARLVAANYQALPMPFKRYQISRVWRADRPAKGRYREFYQCDIDIIGTESLLADAEIAKVIFSVFKTLGFTDFTIKFNSRRLMNRILESVGVPASRTADVIRLIDKLDKIGKKSVARELECILSKEIVQKLLKIITASGANREKIASLKKEDSQEIREFFKLCLDFGISEKNLLFDLSLARGLDYYTGVSYEVVLNDVAIGSVAGGGRYGDLCGLFCEKKFSGAGVAFGFDRIVFAMEELGLLSEIPLSSQVLVTYFDESVLPNSLAIFAELQEFGFNAEIYPEAISLSKQFKYADKKEIPFVVICGSDEIQKEAVTIKSMKTGKQKTVPRNQLTEYLKGLSF